MILAMAALSLLLVSELNRHVLRRTVLVLIGSQAEAGRRSYADQREYIPSKNESIAPD